MAQRSGVYVPPPGLHYLWRNRRRCTTTALLLCCSCLRDLPRRILYDGKGHLTASFVQHRTSLYTRFKSRIALGACRGRAVRGSLGDNGTVSGWLPGRDLGQLATHRRPWAFNSTSARRRTTTTTNRDYGLHTPLYAGKRHEGTARSGR